MQRPIPLWIGAGHRRRTYRRAGRLRRRMVPPGPARSAAGRSACARRGRSPRGGARSRACSVWKAASHSAEKGVDASSASRRPLARRRRDHLAINTMGAGLASVEDHLRVLADCRATLDALTSRSRQSGVPLSECTLRSSSAMRSRLRRPAGQFRRPVRRARRCLDHLFHRLDHARLAPCRRSTRWPLRSSPRSGSTVFTRTPVPRELESETLREPVQCGLRGTVHGHRGARRRSGGRRRDVDHPGLPPRSSMAGSTFSAEVERCMHVDLESDAASLSAETQATVRSIAAAALFTSTSMEPPSISTADGTMRAPRSRRGRRPRPRCRPPPSSSIRAAVSLRLPPRWS